MNSHGSDSDVVPANPGKSVFQDTFGERASAHISGTDKNNVWQRMAPQGWNNLREKIVFYQFQEVLMPLSNDEKVLIEEALALYLQVIARQAPQQQTQQLAGVAQGIIRKLNSLDTSTDGKHGNKPAGISDEWYGNVCLTCNKLSPSGCTDKVTEKYPGKCDPILHYEREKLLKNKP